MFWPPVVPTSGMGLGKKCALRSTSTSPLIDHSLVSFDRSTWRPPNSSRWVNFSLLCHVLSFRIPVLCNAIIIRTTCDSLFAEWFVYLFVVLTMDVTVNIEIYGITNAYFRGEFNYFEPVDLASELKFLLWRRPFQTHSL